MPGIERYVAPRSLEEAAEILRAGNVTIFAGGTDLMPQTQAGRAAFQPVLMNIRRIPGLGEIEQAGDVVRIGALTTITELMDSALVKERLGVLWQACDHFASDQIRNAATLGGNLCNASPAGDTLVPLLVLDARVVLAGKPNGALETRKVPVAEFLAGPGRTTRAPFELLVAIELPLPPAGFHSAFYKLGARPALDIAGVSIGLGGVREGDRLRQVRVAFGAVAPTPIRAPRTEAALERKPLDASTIEAAVAAAAADVHPISDVRASAWYRTEMIRNNLRRMLEDARQR
ncbi:MAG: xanthine dehydrogenase family protein subunit M [Betaproteobacteria bacterium]|nr:xanthine dehydrogenase family protein subunit M [Betaproteobacteria bacterium]